MPLLMARDVTVFRRLIVAAEYLCLEQGKTILVTRIPGSCWATHSALLEQGYRTGTAMVRMKMDENVGYDRPDLYYCDDWL